MASLFNAANILQEYGTYYLNEGQNKQRLIRTLVQPSETLDKYARKIKTDDTIYRMANYTFGDVVRPFRAQFEASSDIEFHPNEIVLRKMKVNIEMTPDEIEEGWLGFLGGDSSRSKKDWPIVRWLMEECIAKQIGEDRELSICYNGVYDAEGTTVNDCMDGIKKLIVNGATADYPINVVSNALVDDVLASIENFDKAIPAAYTNKKVMIFVAPSVLRAYKEAKRASGFYMQNTNDWSEKVEFTNHVVVGLPSMEGTGDVWATVPENLLWITKRDGNLANADVQQHDYQVHIMLDWWEGIGFACNQMVWATAEMLETEEQEEQN